MWNLLSQRYSDVLIGLNGSKSKLTFFSLPSSVRIVPQYTIRPFVGTRLYSLSRCWVDVIAASTESRFTRDLMLDAARLVSPGLLSCTSRES